MKLRERSDSNWTTSSRGRPSAYTYSVRPTLHAAMTIVIQTRHDLRSQKHPLCPQIPDAPEQMRMQNTWSPFRTREHPAFARYCGTVRDAYRRTSNSSVHELAAAASR